MGEKILKDIEAVGKPFQHGVKKQDITYHMFYYWRKKLGPPDLLPKLEVVSFDFHPISDQSGLTIEFQDVKIHLSKKLTSLQALRQ